MKREQGFILFIALTMLALMTIIGIALVRAVDSTNEVANNIGFLQSTLVSSDSGLETATRWLENNLSALENDIEDKGYYARDLERLGGADQLIDYTGNATPENTEDNVDWDGSGPGLHKAMQIPAADAAGNHIAYIIHRQCDQTGSPGGSSIKCAKMTLSTSGSGSKSGVSYGSRNLTGKSRIYYRITTRAKGPRNTASYTQSTVVLEQ